MAGLALLPPEHQANNATIWERSSSVRVHTRHELGRAPRHVITLRHQELSVLVDDLVGYSIPLVGLGGAERERDPHAHRRTPPLHQEGRSAGTHGLVP